MDFIFNDDGTLTFSNDPGKGASYYQNGEIINLYWNGMPAGEATLLDNGRAIYVQMGDIASWKMRFVK